MPNRQHRIRPIWLASFWILMGGKNHERPIYKSRKRTFLIVILKGIQSIRSEQLCGFNPLSLHHMGQPIQLILNSDYSLLKYHVKRSEDFFKRKVKSKCAHEQTSALRRSSSNDFFRFSRSPSFCFLPLNILICIHCYIFVYTSMHF